MKFTNMILAYICILTMAVVIGVPAYVTGHIDVLFVVFVIALIASITVAHINIELEEDYED